MDFALKMMAFTLEMMAFTLKMMAFTLEMIDFTLKMIDDRRQAANRRDCCPCFMNDAAAEPKSSGVKIREFLGETYAPFLLHMPVRIAVLAFAFVWFCVSLWMSADLRQVRDFVQQWMDFALEMMDFVLNLMDFMLPLR